MQSSAYGRDNVAGLTSILVFLASDAYACMHKNMHIVSCPSRVLGQRE